MQYLLVFNLLQLLLDVSAASLVESKVFNFIDDLIEIIIQLDYRLLLGHWDWHEVEACLLRVKLGHWLWLRNHLEIVLIDDMC